MSNVSLLLFTGSSVWEKRSPCCNNVIFNEEYMRNHLISTDIVTFIIQLTSK